MPGWLLFDHHLSIRSETTFKCIGPVVPFVFWGLIVTSSFSSTSTEGCGLLCRRIDLSDAILINIGILFSQVEPNNRNLLIFAINKEHSIKSILVQRNLWFGVTSSVVIILYVAKIPPRVKAILRFWAIAVLGFAVAFIVINFNNVHKEGVCINFTIKIDSRQRDLYITHPSRGWLDPKSLILIN